MKKDSSTQKARKKRQRALEESRGQRRGLLRVYLLERSLVEAQKCCFPHYSPNVSITATFAVNLCPKASIAVPTVPLSRKSCPALLVSLSSSLMLTNSSSRHNTSVTIQRMDTTIGRVFVQNIHPSHLNRRIRNRPLETDCAPIFPIYKRATSDDIISNYHLCRNIPELCTTGSFLKPTRLRGLTGATSTLVNRTHETT